MVLSNTLQRYGLISILLHWVMALLIFGLFGLGLYMTDLSYYDPWYRQGPDLHRSIGVVVATLFLLRLFWKRLSPLPLALSSQKPWELRLAAFVHRILYGLIPLIVVSGYLISTADGRAVSVFGLFEIPALISDIDGQEDVAGVIHLWLAWLMMGMVAVHALGALKHHIIDKDGTLMRMLGRESRQNKSSGTSSRVPN